MSKKTIISIFAVFSVLAVFLILLWTLFALSSVTVNYKTSTSKLNITDEEIVEAGQFHYGACVFFESKNRSAKLIEERAQENETFAYLKVVNIETVFPNKFVIHVAERQEVYAVQTGQAVYICDEEFRVLRKLSAYENDKYNAMLLQNLDIQNQNIEVGDYLSFSQQGILKFYDAMLQNNRSLTEQCGFIQSIKLGKNLETFTNIEYDNLTITTFSGRQYVINNIDFALTNKLQLMFALDSAIFSQIGTDGKIYDENGQVIRDRIIDEEGNITGYGQEWTYERVRNSYILIDNFILSNYQTTTENDIYYRLEDLAV